MRTLKTTTENYEGIRSSETLYSLNGSEARRLVEQFKQTDIPSLRKEYMKNGEYCQEFHFDYGTVMVIDIIKFDLYSYRMEETQLA